MVTSRTLSSAHWKDNRSLTTENRCALRSRWNWMNRLELDLHRQGDIYSSPCYLHIFPNTVRPITELIEILCPHSRSVSWRLYMGTTSLDTSIQCERAFDHWRGSQQPSLPILTPRPCSETRNSFISKKTFETRTPWQNSQEGFQFVCLFLFFLVRAWSQCRSIPSGSKI